MDCKYCQKCTEPLQHPIFFEAEIHPPLVFPVGVQFRSTRNAAPAPVLGTKTLCSLPPPSARYRTNQLLANLSDTFPRFFKLRPAVSVTSPR